MVGPVDETPARGVNVEPGAATAPSGARCPEGQALDAAASDEPPAGGCTVGRNPLESALALQWLLVLALAVAWRALGPPPGDPESEASSGAREE